jgi:membrane-bound metal-dependent hydrolase YbcI (DUF457 family)
MALCFSHSAAGYLAYEAVRPADAHRPGWLAAAVLLANGPDLDFVPGILIGQPGAFHRGVTHTLAAVVMVAAGAWLVGRRRAVRRWAGGWPAGRLASWAGAVYASHLVLDFFSTDSRPPFGAQFLWPFSQAYYLSPVTPLREIVIDPSGRMAFLRSLLQAHTLGVWTEEIAILTSVVLGVYVLRTVLTPVPAPVPDVVEGP